MSVTAGVFLAGLSISALLYLGRSSLLRYRGYQTKGRIKLPGGGKMEVFNYKFGAFLFAFSVLPVAPGSGKIVRVRAVNGKLCCY